MHKKIKSKILFFFEKFINLLPKNYIVNIVELSSLRLTKVEKSKYINFQKENVQNDSIKQINLNLFNTKFYLAVHDNQANYSTYINPNKHYFYEESLLFILSKLFTIFENDQITSNFFDIGSRYGYYSNFIAKRNSKINVYAFDPLKKYYEIQEISKKINSLSNLNVNCIGLSNKDEIFFDEYKNKLELTTLDNFVKKNNISPSIIKVDIDGFEGKFFQGCYESLRDKIEIIFLELHTSSFIQKYSSMNRKQVLEILLKNNFYLFSVSPYRWLKDTKDINFYKKEKKIKLLNLNINNLDNFLFNRNAHDELIFCCKNNNILDKLNIFEI